MPPLRLQDLHGKDVVVAAKPGRITLVNFWATWCAACRLDLPVLASLAGSQRDQLDVVAVCTDTKDLRKDPRVPWRPRRAKPCLLRRRVWSRGRVVPPRSSRSLNAHYLSVGTGNGAWKATPRRRRVALARGARAAILSRAGLGQGGLSSRRPTALGTIATIRFTRHPSLQGAAAAIRVDVAGKVLRGEAAKGTRGSCAGPSYRCKQRQHPVDRVATPARLRARADRAGRLHTTSPEIDERDASWLGCHHNVFSMQVLKPQRRHCRAGPYQRELAAACLETGGQADRRPARGSRARKQGAPASPSAAIAWTMPARCARVFSRMDVGPALQLQVDHPPDAEGDEARA